MPSLENALESLDQFEIWLPTTADRRKIFAEVAAVYDNRKVEMTAEGHIIVMAPASLQGGYLSGEVFWQLANWAKRDGTGKAFDSSAGFYVTPHQNRSPDAAWVLNERIERIPKADRNSFAPFCPDFAIEVRSPSNVLTELRTKCVTYAENGASEAWLIDPERKAVEIFYAEEAVRKFSLPVGAENVTGSGRLAGFRLDLRPIWIGL